MKKGTNIFVVGLILIVLAVAGYFVISQKPQAGVDKSSTNPTEAKQLSNYRDYSKEEFERAREEGKVVMLYFTANWCPTCREQEPVNTKALEALEGVEDIVTFKAHILDSETTDETEKLAKEFGVRLQHSFVILDSKGDVTFTHTGPLIEKDIESQLLSAKSDL